MYKVIDLFSGVGGFSKGFNQNSYKVTKAVEYDMVISQSYSYNHPDVEMINKDIGEINISDHFGKGEADVIIGGPPCQGFSMAGARIRKDFIDDERNYLFKYYYEIVQKVRPKVFVMENVKGILTMQNGQVFKEIKNIFENGIEKEDSKYHISYKVLNAKNFGVPQNRERVFIIGTLEKKISAEIILEEIEKNLKRDRKEIFEPVTIQDAIGNLPNTVKEGSVSYPVPVSEYQKYLSCQCDDLMNHNHLGHSKIATERIKQVKPGENYTILKDEIKSVHSGSYGRLVWDGIAQTITTRFDTPSGGRFIHPYFDRTISPREAARIQSFPDDFHFLGNKSSVRIQIGNAVPPKLGFYISECVKEILHAYYT